MGSKKRSNSTSSGGNDGVSISGLRLKHQQELEKLTLISQPFKTLKLFHFAIIEYLTKSSIYLLSHGGWVLLLGALFAVAATLLVVVDGPHVQHVEEVSRYMRFGLWWVALGVASSIGLGSGLHTFVLYLGPHIAFFTIKAVKCGRVDIKSAIYDTIQLKSTPTWLRKECSEFGPPLFPSSHGVRIPVSSILPHVQLEAILWGLGTALGELPPYFISRAGMYFTNISSIPCIQVIQESAHYFGSVTLPAYFGIIYYMLTICSEHYGFLRLIKISTMRFFSSLSPIWTLKALFSYTASLSGSSMSAMDELDSSTEEGFISSRLTQIKRWLLSHAQYMNFFTILVLASVPNPLFDLAGIMCGQFGVPFWEFFLATMIGKAIIKTHIQTLFLISVCNNQLLHWVEYELIWVLSFIPGFDSIVAILIPKLHAMKEKYLAAKPLVPTDTQAKPWDFSPAFIWNTVVWIMLLNFFVKIVDSTAQGYLKEQQDKDIAALKNKSPKQSNDSDS